MYEARHDSGDSPQLEGLQTQQAPDTERSTHDREARETAEARARKEAQTKTSGDPHLRGDNKNNKLSLELAFEEQSCNAFYLWEFVVSSARYCTSEKRRRRKY